MVPGLARHRQSLWYDASEPNHQPNRTLAFLDDQIRSGKCQLSKGAVLDVGASNGFEHVSMDQCPCITRTISGSKRLWFVNPEKKFIQLTTEAYAALQGFPSNFVPKLRTVGLSDRQIRLALGNAMNYAMLARIVDEIIAMIHK